MASSRIATALDTDLVLPDGPVWLLQPPVAWDGEALKRPLWVSQSFKPASDAWAARAAAGQPVAAAAAVVVVPRSKALARALVAEAARAAPLVIVDGQKTDGVDGLWKAVRKLGIDGASVTKGHGRLFWFGVDDALRAALDGWRAEPGQGSDGFWRQAGVFSEDGVDPGSALLAEALPASLPPVMADFGAGWGYLAAAVLARTGVTRLDMVEAEARALDCARLNVTDPRARFLWQDVPTFAPGPIYDGIVMNPPFHPDRRGDPGLGRAFIAAAAAALADKGRLWMVANRHLPYEAALETAFREVQDIGGDRRFKLFEAARPARETRRNRLG